MKKSTTERPHVEIPKDTQQWESFFNSQREKPIAKAADKLFRFVNECVSDPDFRHEQSEHLLFFLMLVRDVMADGINENWTLDDILMPIEEAVKKRSARIAAEGRHNKPGGSRDLKNKIREVWATGKYSSRDICAEQEWSDIGYKSFSAARKALRGTPDPA